MKLLWVLFWGWFIPALLLKTAFLIFLSAGNKIKKVKGGDIAVLMLWPLLVATRSGRGKISKVFDYYNK